MKGFNEQLESEERFERRIASEAKQRDFRHAKENGLLEFGNELFRGEYSIDDFVADAAMVNILSLDSEKSKEYYKRMLEKYSKINNFLTYEQILSLSERNTYLDNIRMGYEYEKRQKYISEIGKGRK